MAEHTPGPWRFDQDWHRIPTILGADGAHVATVEKDNFIHGKFPGIGHTEPKPERDANARLIAAAPELLAALSGLLSDLDNPDLIDIRDETIAQARAVVAKAEAGGSK